MPKLYTAFAMLMLGSVAWIHWTGWGLTPTDRLTNVPRSVRDNPGSYRAHYTMYYHHASGK